MIETYQAALAIDGELSELLSVSGIEEIEKDAPLSKVEAVLRTLAELVQKTEPIRRAVAREAAIRVLKGAGIGSPAALVDAALGREPEATEIGKGGTAVLFADVEPWPADVDGASLLAEFAVLIQRFVILPPGADVALALWLLHTYGIDAADASPILAVTSPEKRCGKTIVLELAQALALKALPAANITAPALFRTVEAHAPTLLIDEADSFLKDSEELRGVLNSGHRRPTAVIVRLAGDDHEPRTFSTWCPKAIALIGTLPGTLEDRSIVVNMRRKTPEEKTERLRYDQLTRDCGPLRQKAARWAADNMKTLRDSDPRVPAELNDRGADCWRPLLAIADAAGGDWPGMARSAALTLSAGVAATDSSAQVRLLSDIKAMFERRNTDRLSSDEIVAELAGIEDSPWPEWKNGKPITKTQLARVLGHFGVGPQTIRIGEQTAKGYMRDRFEDAFGRYTGSQSVTTAQAMTDTGSSDFSKRNTGERVTHEKRMQSITGKGCDGVTDGNKESWRERV